MLNNYLLQMRETMRVLDTNSDSNLQENFTRSQNSVICMNVWHLKCKKLLFEN